MRSLKPIISFTILLVMIFSIVPFSYAEGSACKAPLLFEGEELFCDWAFQLIDVDGNGIDDRISFLNFTKDDSEEITARLAIEFDYETKTQKEPLYIERQGGHPVHPILQCVNTGEDTLIILKDPAFGGSVSIEILYPFLYSDGTLTELADSVFPENSILGLDCFKDENFSIEWNSDTEFEVWYGEDSEKSQVSISQETFDYKNFDAEYGVRLWFDENKLDFDPHTCNITAIAYGSISNPEENFDGLDFTPFMVNMVLKYTEGNYTLDSIEFIDTSLMHRVSFKNSFVNYYDWQYVLDGEDAIPPTFDDIDGYYFEGWDLPYTNITEDVDITAIYWQYGDANKDGNLNTGDATAILGYIVEKFDFDETQIILADMNDDSLVNTGDAVMILLNTVNS